MASLKTKASFTALILAAAVGFYFFGSGSRTDTSKDRRAQINVEFDQSPRDFPVEIWTTINGKQRSFDRTRTSPWNEAVWLRPGEVLRVTARQLDWGFVTCAITMEGAVFGPREAGPSAGSQCIVDATF